MAAFDNFHKFSTTSRLKLYNLDFDGLDALRKKIVRSKDSYPIQNHDLPVEAFYKNPGSSYGIRI